jgi:hypothetical protein
MNGEPRQRNLTTADLVASAKKPESLRNEADRALQDDAMTDHRVTPTSKEETHLAPRLRRPRQAIFVRAGTSFKGVSSMTLKKPSALEMNSSPK